MRRGIALLLLTLTACGAKPYPRFIERNGKPAVRVTVNTHGPHCADADTGVRRIIIRADFPSAAGAKIIAVKEAGKAYRYPNTDVAILNIDAAPGRWTVLIGTEEEPYVQKIFWIFDCRAPGIAGAKPEDLPPTTPN
jgi:hypothetical protein